MKNLSHSFVLPFILFSILFSSSLIFLLPWDQIDWSKIYVIFFENKEVGHTFLKNLGVIFCGFIAAEIAYLVAYGFGINKMIYIKVCYVLIICVIGIFGLSYFPFFSNNIGYLFYIFYPFCISFSIFSLFLARSLNSKRHTFYMMFLLAALIFSAQLHNSIEFFPL